MFFCRMVKKLAMMIVIVFIYVIMYVKVRWLWKVLRV